MRLLLLEDDSRLRAAYAARLRADGNAVDEVSTLAEARQWLDRVAFDCLVLDRRVPDGDSVDLVTDLDASAERPFILMVSGLGAGDERVRGLTVGADDYMVKPVRLDELVLRVRKLLARQAPRRIGSLQLGRVSIDRDRHHVAVDGAGVHLTPTQFAILVQLAINVDRVVSKEHLLEHCWDGRPQRRVNPLHSHITRLRRLFDGSLVFESSWGTGYALRVARVEERPLHPVR
jgi:DNA-binding response OmpR family regulator